MARVSITEAARLAGIGRSSFYQTYINKGAISVSKDSSGKKFIETSELIRVFGELGGNTSGQEPDIQSQTEGCAEVLGVTLEETARDLEIKMLREQLEKSEQREQWLQSQVQNLTDTVKLLEAPKKPQHPRLWYQFWK